jgi:hypothetical protein
MLPSGYARTVTEFLVGCVVGASAVLLLVILFPWTKRIRDEKPLPPDVEAQLLLGMTPTEDAPEPESPTDHPRPYSPEDLAQLRRLGHNQKKRR